jgi:predicted transcriptional regulator
MELLEFLRMQKPFLRMSPWDPVSEAAERMLQKEIGALAVMENSRVIGLLTQKCLLRNYRPGAGNGYLPLSELMERKFLSLSPGTSLERAFSKVNCEPNKYALVVENSGRPLGLVGAIDLAEVLLKERDFHIEQLERYIQGPYENYTRPRYFASATMNPPGIGRQIA